MHIRFIFRRAALLLVAPTLAVAAGLGSTPTPPAVEARSAAMAKSSERPAAAAGYTVNEVRTAAGGLIREYVSPDGIVFGISWRSPIVPDLQALLGSYFPTFEQAATDSRASGRRGPLAIDRSDLVLRSGGQMRDYRGRAYVPALLPPGVAGTVVQ